MIPIVSGNIQKNALNARRFYIDRGRDVTFSTPAIWVARVLLFVAIGSSLAGFSSGQDTLAEPEESVDAAVTFFQKGQDAHEKGELTQAIELYGKALAAMPEFPEAEYQRAAAYQSLGRAEDAEKGFRRALELRPDWTLALGSLGSILVSRAAYPEAEKILVRALELNDQNTLAFTALTELRLRSGGSNTQLRELLVRAIDLTQRAKPTASIWAARGALEASLNERSAAKTSLDRALEIDPKSQYALSTKASLMLDDSDTAGADSLVVRLEAIPAARSEAAILRARSLLIRGKDDDALQVLNGLKDPSRDAVALRDRIILSQQNDPGDLERRLEKRPGDPLILGKLCSALRTADPNKALQYCRQASAADPSNINYAIGFGAALVQAKEYSQAVDLFRKLQAISPENVTLRANLATALFQLKRYVEAKKEYQWLTEHRPEAVIAYYFLAICHDQLSELEDAAANYQLFLRKADAEQNKLEIEKVTLRLPILDRQLKEKKGKR